jgi:hypothetical protein
MSQQSSIVSAVTRSCTITIMLMLNSLWRRTSPILAFTVKLTPRKSKQKVRRINQWKKFSTRTSTGSITYLREN